MSTAPATLGVGPMLREWRRRRRLSQLDLALEAGVSARHISFLETGRSSPSREMIVQLAEEMEVPLRERNGLLHAAGFAPLYEQRELADPGMAPVKDAVRQILSGHEPYPAMVIDGAWEMLAANLAVGMLTDGVDPALLEPPLNVLRVSLHPDGLAPRIANLDEWRSHLLDRLRRQIRLTGSEPLRTLLSEAVDYPTSGGEHNEGEGGGGIAVPLRLRTDDGVLSFISTVSTFGTAVEVTTSELSIESFFPLDEATERALRRRAGTAREPQGDGKM